MINQPIKHFGVGIQSLGEKVCTVVKTCAFFISVDKDCDDTTIDMYTWKLFEITYQVIGK